MNKLLLTFLIVPLKTLFLLTPFYFSFHTNAQTPGEWTWMAGSNSTINANYGIQGVAATTNTPPSPVGAAEWTDLDGNLWLFGGESVNSTSVNPPSSQQDLWKFDITTNMWTWIHGSGVNGFGQPVYGVLGSFGTANIPRGTWSYGHCCKNVTWTDLNGDLWMTVYDIIQIGNNSYTGSSTWKYSIALNQWACMHQGGYDQGVLGVSSNTNSPQPGASNAAWVADDGNLWFVDGFATMWTFNVSTNQWTRMHSGLNSTSMVSGTMGVYNSNNRPGQQNYMQHWKSNDGTFYMFGGADWSSPTRNNMWQYDPTINQWRIVAGLYQSNTASFTANCTFDASNHPSNMLFQGNCWKDDCNRFYGLDEGAGGYIWCFDPVINQYAKISGSVAAYGSYLSPSYGAQGVSSPSNFPGSYPFQANGWSANNMGGLTPSWTDANGNFWKMGSSDFETNSLWRYTPDLSCLGGSISALFTSSSIQGCAPLVVDFEALTPSNIDAYEWDFGDVTVTTDVSTDATPSYTFTDAGVYTVQLIVNGQPGCGANAIDTAEMIITIVDVPQFTLTEDTTICEGSSVTLSVSGASSYTWTPVTGLNVATGNSVVASPSTETTYIVNGDNFGCIGTDSVKVSIASLPVLIISDVTICSGGTAELSISGADAYIWSPPVGLSATIGSSVDASPTNTTTYTIEGLDQASNCTASTQVTVSIEEIEVNVNSETLCANDQIDLVTLNATGANSYAWSPSTALSATSGSTVISTVDQTITYTVIGTSLSGCTDTAEAIVTYVPPFDVLVNSGDICEGEELLLIANGANSYEWSPPMGLNATTGTEVLSSPLATTTYTVVGFVDGCTDTTYSTVNVIPIPDASIFVSPSSVSSLDPEISVSTSPNNSNTLEWLLDGEFLSNQDNFTHLLPLDQPGEYTLQLISINSLGCADTAEFIIKVEGDIAFYIPNAFTPDGDAHNNTFQPVITAGIDLSNYSFQLYNRWGEAIFTTDTIDEGWDGTYKGRMSLDGTYTWKLEFKELQTARRHLFMGHVSLIR